MNKIIFTALLLIAISYAKAQQQETSNGRQRKVGSPYKTMTFMGIPIKGTVAEFDDKLKAKGFTPLTKEKSSDVAYICDGQFAGRKAKVGVKTTPKTKEVFEVSVFFEKHTVWQQLLNDYTETVEGFCKKYKDRCVNFEEETGFDENYYGNDAKMRAVKNRRSNYYTWFDFDDEDTGHGSIVVSIGPLCCVGIFYTDALGEAKNDKEEEQIKMADY